MVTDDMSSPVRGKVGRHGKPDRGLNQDPVLGSIEDHFTLPGASNLVRFRNRRNAARVYEANGVQMVLEETYDHSTRTSTITAKRLTDDTFGTSFLRMLYTIVTSLFTGFFFVFCLQVLLFLVLDLAVESGATALNSSLHVGSTGGVVMAIIVFVTAFAEALVIAGAYIVDMWTGHYLAKQFFFKKLNDVTTEWIFFVMFLLLPLLVMAGSLLAESAHWWSNTAIVWFSCVMVFFAIFCFNIVFYEVKAAYDFADNWRDDDSTKSLHVLKRCVLLRQRHKYSGKNQNLFLARSYFSTTEDTDSAEKSQIYDETRVVSHSWWCRVTEKCPEWMFEKLEVPRRLNTIEDVQDYRPFLTSNSWSLEKIFCRPTNSRYIAIIQGPGALTQSQLRSSLVCSVIGTCLGVLLLISLLVWFQIPGPFVAFVFVIALIVSWTALKNTRNLFKIGKDIIDVKTGLIRSRADDVEKDTDEKDTENQKGAQNPKEVKHAPSDDEEEETKRQDTSRESVSAKDKSDMDWQEEAGQVTVSRLLPPDAKSLRYWNRVGTKPSEAVYLVAEYHRINKATESFCWVMVGVELIVFYFYPLITLGLINGNLCGLFFLCATVAGIRHYINIGVIIEELGNMDLVGGGTSEEKWENKCRLNTIVDGITEAKSRKVWTSILGAGGFGFLAIFLGAVGSSTENTDAATFTYLPNFTYPGLTNDMRYPTCTLSNMKGGFGVNTTLLDYAFVASIAYVVEEDTQSELDSWFGPSGTEAIFDKDYVDAFREENDPDNLPVFFKMFRFPQLRFGMIVIRGTSNNWDMLADTQLWSAAALMQGLRAALPAGEVWTPIIDQLVNWINTIQSESMKKISFYKLTTQFAEFMKKDGDFDSVQVTGHSLGGGLSMITGAQAKIPAIGLSGPNALISGKSFNPPVSKEDMNKYTFNIVPRRDIVPMLDDLADQFQYIRCEADPWDFVGCHFSKRSLCELMVTCGSGSRPAICECHLEYGYPKPVTDGDEDFDELCGVN